MKPITHHLPYATLNRGPIPHERYLGREDVYETPCGKRVSRYGQPERYTVYGTPTCKACLALRNGTHAMQQHHGPTSKRIW